MDQIELKVKIAAHAEWIGAGCPYGDPRRANLSGANLPAPKVSP